MFVFYTLLYLILNYISPFFAVLIPQYMIFITVAREGYWVYLFFQFFLNFTTNRKYTLNHSLPNKLLTVCVLLALPYILISSNLGFAITTFILYFLGPIIYLLISNLTLSDRTRKKFDFYLYLVLFSLCILGILFYLIQGQVVRSIDPTIYNLYSRPTGIGDTRKLRFLGIGLHPTVTGFLFIYFIAYCCIVKRKYILGLINTFFFYLTGTRSAILGLPFYILLKFKKPLKILSIIFGVGVLVVVYALLVSGKINMYLDGSVLAHLIDLFIEGPEMVIKYPLGAGLGTVSPYNQENPIVHLESEMYLYMIQLGFISFVIKVAFYILIIKALYNTNSKKSNYLIFILLIFLTGSMVFALNDARFISNFIWILLGIEFSKPEYQEIKYQHKKTRLLVRCLKVKY